MRASWRAIALGCFALTMGTGCSKDSCEEAVSKVTGECELGGGFSLGNLQECTEEIECRADCVIDADCDELTEVDENGAPVANDYTQCLADCAAEFAP